jgi:hypothetical protein
MTDIFSDRSAAASCVAAVLGLFFASGCEGIVGGIGAGDGGRCTSSTQCKAGEVCRNYSCVAAGACTKKSDCMSDEDCIEGKCSAAAADAGNGRSDGGRSDGGSPCQKDEECAGGYRCEPTTRLCEPVAVIEVTPAGVLDFGPVPAAETDTKLVTIQNKGRAVLYLTGFDLANPKDNPCFLIHSGGISTELPEGATHRLEIRYRQEDDLADEGTLSIISSDPYKGAYPLKLRSTYRGSPDFAVFARDPATMQWNADYPKPGSGYEYAVDLGYVTQGTVRKTVIGMKNATTGDAILAIRAMVPKNTPKNPFAYRFMNGPDPETAAELPAPVLTAPLTHVYLSAGVMVYLHADYDAKSKVDQDGLDLELVANDGDMNNSGAAGHNAVTIK